MIRLSDLTLSLRSINANAHEVNLGPTGVLLFSYGVLVAAKFNDTLYITEQKWSNTTTRHTNTFRETHGGKFTYYLPQQAFTSGLILDADARAEYRAGVDLKRERLLASLSQ